VVVTLTIPSFITWTIPHGIVCFEIRQTDGGEERMTGDRGAFGAMAIGCHHRLLVCVARSLAATAEQGESSKCVLEVFWVMRDEMWVTPN
jgi:hypothetical protein